MDPNVNLQEQETILQMYANTCGPVPEANTRLRELRQALEHWIDHGGFAPEWDACPLATKYWAMRLGF